MSKEKPITSDLFAVDTCYHCNGDMINNPNHLYIINIEKIL